MNAGIELYDYIASRAHKYGLENLAHPMDRPWIDVRSFEVWLPSLEPHTHYCDCNCKSPYVGAFRPSTAVYMECLEVDMSWVLYVVWIGQCIRCETIYAHLERARPSLAVSGS